MLVNRSIAETWTLATTRRPERYSALAFLDTGQLPTYSRAGVPQQVTFRITNHEAAETRYAYVASIGTGSSTTVVDRGTVTVADGASMERTITYTLPDPEMNAQVIVQLVDRSEYITFGTKS